MTAPVAASVAARRFGQRFLCRVVGVRQRAETPPRTCPPLPVWLVALER